MSRARDNANLGAQAGSGLDASDLTTGTLGNTVQDNITRVGTVGTGTWEGTTVAVNQGGTGVTTKTGTGNVVLSSSPTLVTPELGTPASGNASNLTSIPADDLTGTITSGTQDAITRLGTVTTGTIGGSTVVNTSGAITTTGGFKVSQGDITPAVASIYHDSSSRLRITGGTAGYLFQDDTNSTNHLKIDSAGDVTVNTGNLVIPTADKGIYFSGGTDPDTAGSITGGAAGNTLTDYEEGTWTPNWYGSAGSTTFPNEGLYTKIGNMVYCYWSKIGFDFNGSYAGSLSIGGLPFTGGATTSHVNVGSNPYFFPASAFTAAGECGLVFLKNSNDSNLGVRIQDVAGDTDTPFPASRISGATNVYYGFIFSYRV